MKMVILFICDAKPAAEQSVDGARAECKSRGACFGGKKVLPDGRTVGACVTAEELKKSK